MQYLPEVPETEGFPLLRIGFLGIGEDRTERVSQPTGTLDGNIIGPAYRSVKVTVDRSFRPFQLTSESINASIIIIQSTTRIQLILK